MFFAGNLSKAAYEGNLLAVCTGQSVFLLQLDLQSISLIAQTEMPQQISALDFLLIWDVCMLCVGEWMTNSIKILNSTDLHVISEICLENLQPRSVSLLNTTSPDYMMLVGTSTGSVVSISFAFDKSDQTFSFDKILSTVQIGRSDVKLIPINNGVYLLTVLDGVLCIADSVLAYCDAAAVIEPETGEKEGAISATRLFFGPHACLSIAAAHLNGLSDALVWTNETGELRLGQLDLTPKIRWTTLAIGRRKNPSCLLTVESCA